MTSTRSGSLVHLKEWGTVLGVGLVYTMLRAWATPEDPSVAVLNAMDIVELELKISLFVERALQSAILSKAWLVEVLNTYYVAMHLPPILGFLVYTYVQRPRAWPLVRDAVLAFTLLGLVVHIVYPVAPPWFVDQLAIGDTFEKVHETNLGSSTVGNPFAAMPSMHFGWALAAGVGMAVLVRPLWAKLLCALHPVVMGVAIVATGNHYVLDAAGSALLLGLAVAIVGHLRGWERLTEPTGGSDPPPDPSGSTPSPEGTR